jgi:hypothetical protein
MPPLPHTCSWRGAELSTVKSHGNIYYTVGSIVTGGWRKPNNEELHNLYSSPSIIRVIKSRRMRLAGHAARMGRGGMHIGYWWGSQKKRDHWEDKDVDGWTILKLILEM